MVLVATQVKRRRGTGAENDAFTGAEGEITVDLTNKELRVHTGDNKVGGYGLARKDFENITDEAKNISNWSSNVANCITNIPQDIKLELNNGTLTLKAGSKVYVPNGAGVFDEVVIASDLTHSYSTATVAFMVFYDHSSNVLRLREPSQAFSGTTAPTSYTDEVWYDTTNNIIKFSNNSGSTWSRQYSFPICIASATNGVGFTSIDQVFNGFGYIGSTVFALPNVKGLIPNGRNEDGSLKNTEFIFNSVIVSTDTSNYSDVIYLVSDGTDINRRSYDAYGYDRFKNIITYNGTQENKACIGLCHRESGKISKLYSKPVFHSLDRSETDFIAQQAMPSKKSVSLTLGASGATYTAPADGWAVFLSTSVANSILRSGNFGSTVIGASGYINMNILPVKKGNLFTVTYSTSSGSSLQFFYAQGVTF